MNENRQYDYRFRVILGMIAGVLLLFTFRLFYLQVIESQFKDSADSNAFLKRTIFPSRGSIYDRNGKLLVFNQPAYDVMVISREIGQIDTLDFCATLGIERRQFDERFRIMRDKTKNPGFSPYTPQVFLQQLTVEDYGKLQEKLYRYPGFFIQKRIQRDYSFPMSAHLIGYLGEASPKEIEADSYNRSGDYIGKSGIEKTYEMQLRGTKGYEILMRDARGRLKGRYQEGKYDIAPIPGKDLHLTIDIELQQYAEALMANKLGSIVAIEPRTGEVLCLVSSPTYDPRVMVGRGRSANYKALANDPNKPLFDRPLMAAYPPGSIFKTAQALVFLQEKIITPQTSYPCTGGFAMGGIRVGCHAHSSPLSLVPSISQSCNAYYCYGLREYLERGKRSEIHNRMDHWRDYMVDMGFGYPLGIDLPHEKRGLIPNSNFYSKIYGNNGWRGLTVISIAIGQGEVLTTPLQICNLSATIANRGHFTTPHVVRRIVNDTIAERFRQRHKTKIAAHYYDPIIEGMRGAVTGGTARVANLSDIEICGKTGTAQNPHGRDHSIFMCFAPQINPSIALAVYVENAGFGATYAAPIAALLVEKYLKRTISPQNKAKEMQMLNTRITLNGIQGSVAAQTD